jgi:uncharacterized membrane protein
MILAAIVLVVFLFIRFSPVKRGVKRYISLGLRSLIIILLVFSLSGLSISSTVDRVHTVFLVDASDSLDDVSRSISLDAIAGALGGMRETDTAGLVVFGRDASVEIAPRADLQSLALESEVQTNATDIAQALQIGMAALPQAGTKRLVLFSDGNENRGSAGDIAAVARASGIEIYTVPLETSSLENEIYVKGILAPSEVNAGQNHEFTVTLNSLKDSFVRLTVFKDGQYAGEDEITLLPGDNSITYASTFDAKGLHRYQIEISSDDDTIEENNRTETFVQVTGQPSILYISDEGEASASLINALIAQGISVSGGTVVEIPDTLAGLLQYDALILDNVPGFDMSFAKMELIEQYVKNAGGGVLMIGGSNSFGVGGYYKTPIERALPVDMDVTSQADIPSLTLVMVADKSGSMGGVVDSGETKLDLVKEATLSAVGVLNPFYKVGLLAFDADFEWTVPIVAAVERDKIIEDLYGLSSGGGTDLHKAFAEAYRVLKDTASAVKHIILLSDGLTEEADFEGLAKLAVEQKITVSTVAVGEDANRELMTAIAEWGEGRSYYTQDMARVPRIFASETIIVSRGLIIEESFFPVISAYSDIVGGIDPSGVPPLEGLVLTYLKAGASQVMSAADNSPLLAVWRYGLGKTAAFTSDLRGKWGKNWLSWDQYPQFVSQLIRWTERTRSPQRLITDFNLDKGEQHLTVDALDEGERFINQLAMKASVVRPDRVAEEINLDQIAPGRYTGVFSAEQTGPYYVTLYGEKEDLALPPTTFGAVVPYPREFIDLSTDRNFLKRLAEIAGGKMIEADDEEALKSLFTSGERRFEAFRRIWLLLILIALPLFVLDIAVRKIQLPEGFWLRLRAFLRRRGTESLSYSEMSDIIEAKRSEEEENIRQKGLTYWFKQDRDDKDLSNRIYMAKLRSEKLKRRMG